MGGDLHIVSPSLPSMPRKVPSGHGTKSSILYLHSPGVRPKAIVRPSGHPLIQDSLTHHGGRLTCGPTKLTGMEGFVNLVNMNDSSSSDRTMSIHRPSCFFNLYSSCSSRSNKRRRDCLLPPPRGRLCCRAGLTAPPYSHRWPSHPSTHPHLLLFSGDGRRTSKPSFSRTPLRVGNKC